MNQWQLNGQLLGEGVNDPRVFLSMNGLARATSTTVIYARRYMVSAITATGAAVSRLDGVFRLASSIRASATSSIESFKYYAKYLTGSVTGKATSTLASYAVRYMIGIKTVAALTSTVLWRGRYQDSAIIARATGVSTIFETGFRAAPERVMVLPAEDRKMKVS